MPKRPVQGSITVLTLFLVLFLGVADNQVLSPLLPAIRAQFGRNSAELALVFTGYSIAAALSVLFWGPLSDRLGSKRGLLAGLAVFGCGSAVSSLSRTYGTLVLARVITGTGASMLSLNAISYAAAAFPYRKRGRAMGSIVSSYFAALILGVPAGSWIGDRFGWSTVFTFILAGSCLLWLAVFLLLTSFPGADPQADKRPRQGEALRIYLGFTQNGETLGALLSALFASAGAVGFLAFLGVWLHDAFRLSAREIGLVFLASGAAALVASPLAGALYDRIGKRVQFIASSGALAFLLLLLPALEWGWFLFLAFGAISMAAAFRQGPLEALITEVISPARRGSFLALRNAFSQLGIALSASAGGLLFQAHGYWAVCLLGCAANLAAALLMAMLVSRKHL
ncbi:MAG: MFS transporter [Acidobacteria bacterium]|nr:MFS transporter [Acidobacteriota bacterium]